MFKLPVKCRQVISDKGKQFFFLGIIFQLGMHEWEEIIIIRKNVTFPGIHYMLNETDVGYIAIYSYYKITEILQIADYW